MGFNRLPDGRLIGSWKGTNTTWISGNISSNSGGAWTGVRSVVPTCTSYNEWVTGVVLTNAAGQTQTANIHVVGFRTSGVAIAEQIIRSVAAGSNVPGK
ncbi:hypothetical protein [Caulobacter sp. DWR2-3-1b2]|uniref:hypothetical protein n=1 Tax=Caulobacter sp. DWR2-3-1b2 TaxID=2804642 RepID=UPI003CEF4B7B